MVERLGKRFGKRVAFAELSFAVGWGEVFGFLGPNGAGKTSTVRTLGTLLAPTAGRAVVAGLPLQPDNGPAIRARISIMPESPGLYLRLTGSGCSVGVAGRRTWRGALPLTDLPVAAVRAARPVSV